MGGVSRYAIKTAGIDSHLIARFWALVGPRPWAPPAPEVRPLKSLLARRAAIAEDLRRKHNRLEKAEATETPAQVLDSLAKSIDFLARQIEALQRETDDHIDRHPGLKRDLYLLQSIHTVGPQVGLMLLALLHGHAFQSAEQVAAYLGLVPVERQSGTSVLGRSRLPKASPARVRAVLYMTAVVAIRHNPHVKALYERLLARGKSKMSALGASIRKLVHLGFGVFKNKIPYQPNYSVAT